MCGKTKTDVIGGNFIYLVELASNHTLWIATA